MIHLKDENFNELIKEGIVMVDFYANWCGPCKMLAPILENFSQKNPAIKIIKVDVDQHKELSINQGVMSIPTLLLIKDGKEIKRQSGYMTEDGLTKWVDLK